MHWLWWGTQDCCWLSLTPWFTVTFWRIKTGIFVAIINAVGVLTARLQILDQKYKCSNKYLFACCWMCRITNCQLQCCSILMFGNTNSVEDVNIFTPFASGQSKLRMLLSHSNMCALCRRVCIIHGSKVYNCAVMKLAWKSGFLVFRKLWAYVEYPRAFMCSFFVFSLQSSKV